MLCLYVCTMRAWYLWGSEDGLALPELELQVIVSQCMGSGNRTQVLKRATNALNSEASLCPSPP